MTQNLDLSQRPVPLILCCLLHITCSGDSSSFQKRGEFCSLQPTASSEEQGWQAMLSQYFRANVPSRLCFGCRRSP